MAQEARLMLGPRDGEVLALVEPTLSISIMCEPSDPKHHEYDEHLYLREQEPREPGIYYYIHAGIRPTESEQPHEDSQD